MTLLDWKPVIDVATAVFSLAAAILGLIAAMTASSASKAAERIENNVNNLRNDLNATQRQNLQLVNAPRIEFNPNLTFNTGDVMQRPQPLDAQQMTHQIPAQPTVTEEGPGEKS